MLLGSSILIIACLCQGSFGIGYKKYSPFSWAGFWGVYCICCMIISSVVAFTLVPSFSSMIGNIPVLGYICGGLWGISAIGFSKGIGRIGMTMVYGISMGVSTIVGTITPMLLSGSEGIEQLSVVMFLGMFITVIGIILFTVAGIKRDGKQKKDVLGYGMAIFSGLGSGAMNVGFSLSRDMEAWIGDDVSYLGLSAAKWFPVLFGGLLVGLLWCICEVTLKKEWNTVFTEGALRRSEILFLVGIVWYAALLLYGYANTILYDKLGEMTWVLFNSISLVVSVFWGIKGGEWKGHSKKRLVVACTVLIISLFIISL